MNLFDLHGKVIIVTGGYGHIGNTICRGLYDHGAIIYVFGKSEDKFKSQFYDETATIYFKSCDISNTLNIQQSLLEVFEQHQRINVFINNAFYLRGQNPLCISDEDWQYSIDGTLNSVYRCIREVVPYFLKNSGGKIINISSMYGLISPDFKIYDNHPDFLNPPQYGAAKAGVIQLTKYFAQYLGHYNIQVNAISPGPFPNESVQLDQEFVQELANRTSLKRIGKTDELVGSAIFLSSAASNFITGHNLVVDGGWTIT